MGVARWAARALVLNAHASQRLPMSLADCQLIGHPFDVLPGVGRSGFGGGPSHANVQCIECHAIDRHGFAIGSPEASVPERPPYLERFDFKRSAAVQRTPPFLKEQFRSGMPNRRHESAL